MYKASVLKLVIFPSFNPSLVRYKINESLRNVSIGVDSITRDLAIFSVNVATTRVKEELIYPYLKIRKLIYSCNRHKNSD